MALIVNVNRDPKKGRPCSPSDFSPYRDVVGQAGPEQGNDIRDLKQALRRMKR